MQPPREWCCVQERRSSWIFGAVIAVACAGCSPSSQPPAGTEIAAFDYDAGVARHASCKPGTRMGAAGNTDGLRSSEEIDYIVRTPSNYDPTFAHPLLVVYAAAGVGAAQNEQLIHLTSAATSAGFVIAYTGHRPMSVDIVHQLAKVPSEIAAKWCIDRNRVYATGHSDGGTVSTAVALLEETRGTFAGIAPSAAGFQRSDFETFKCPSAPIPVMIMHSSWDMLFPGWGAQAAKWWAACNGCDVARPPDRSDAQCVTYQGCADNGVTRYCEGTGWHSQWPDLGAQLIHFLASHGRDSLSDAHDAHDLFSAICRAPRGAGGGNRRSQSISESSAESDGTSSRTSR